MPERTQLFFLDFGLSIAKDGILQGRILSCDGDGQGLKTVLEGLRALPDGICITDNHIYYTAMGNPKKKDGAIYRCDLDGRNVETIVKSGDTYTPKQIQVVPELGKLYWSDREGMRVLRCSLDGSDLETLV